MEEHRHFDERIAAVYDDYKNDPTRTEFAAEDIAATIEFLARFARKGMRSSSVSELAASRSL